MNHFFKIGAPLYMKVLLYASNAIFGFNTISHLWRDIKWVFVSPAVDLIIGSLLVLGALIFKSRICALLQLAYSIWNFIELMKFMPVFFDWDVVAGAICCVVATFSFQKLYSDYKKYYLNYKQPQKKADN